jgi:hypothetical protein
MNFGMFEIVEKIGYVPSAVFVIISFALLTYWLLNFSKLAGWFSKEDLVGPFFSYAAVLFALFSAMVATDIWGRYKDATTAVVNEAAAVRSLLTSASYLDQQEGQQLRAAVQNYVDVLVSQEWPVMHEADTSRKEVAHRALEQLSATALGVTINQSLPKVLESRLQQAIDVLRSSRLQRLSLAFDHVTYAKWRALILFGCLSIFSVAVVHVRKRRAMATALCIAVAGILLTIVVLANNRSPFAGIDPVKPGLIKDSLLLFDLK